jgi:nucleoid-associated protein YgaU
MKIASAGVLMMLVAGILLLFPSNTHPGWAQAASRCGQRMAVVELPRARADVDRQAVTDEARPLFRTVTVQPGDSLWTLAHDYLGDGSRAGDIAWLSRIPNFPHVRILQPGESVNIPWS